MKKKLVKKLKFTKEQKKEYKKLKVIVGLVGIIGLVLTIVFYIFEYRDISYIIISITLAFLLIYVYQKYRKILSKTKVTRTYYDFQKQMCALALFFTVPYFVLLIYLVFYQMEFFAKNPILLIVLMIIPGIIGGILVAYYEKKKFGAIMRAP